MPDAAPPKPRTPLAVKIIFAAAVVALVTAVGAWAWSARPPKAYDARTPEAMLDSARQMIVDRQAERLVELIEVAPPDDTAIDRERMTDLYARLGGVLGAAQDLSDTVAAAFPDELARFRAELEQARASGKPTGLFAQLARSGRGQRGRSGGNPIQGLFGSGASRVDAERVFTALLAEPYRGIADGRDRVTATTIDDRTVALLFDNKPIAPPFGLVLREQPDGRWQLVPPTNLPFINRFLPKTADEYAIWGSLLTTFENVLIDLDRGVASGQIDSLDRLADEAFEKVAVPAGMVMVAYGRAMEARRERGGP
jgi:hypothetical protein